MRGAAAGHHDSHAGAVRRATSATQALRELREVAMRSLNHSLCVFVGVVALVLGVCCVRAADEKDDDEAKKLKESDVPQKVMDAVKARFPGAKVESAERETEDGNVIYDVELTADGRKYEADLKEDGTFIEIEKALDAKDHPAALTAAVKAKWPNAKIKEVMEKSLVTDGKETVHEYEVVLQVGDKEQEVTLSKDGKVVEEAAGDEKKDDDKGKDEDDKDEKK
jgi:uncharacterized membrane protein YkoI